MRDPYFDFLKGIAIWLVVFGHCMLSFHPNCIDECVFWALCAFHMPLFMAISGKFFLSSVAKVSCATFIKKKFVRLYLPSLSWGLIHSILFSGASLIIYHKFNLHFTLNLIYTGMWFLTALFILNVIGAFIEKWTSSKRYVVWLFLFILLYFSPSFWMRNQLLFLMPFFVASFLLRKYKWDNCPLWLGLLSLSIFSIVLLRFYSFDVSLYRMTDDVLSLKYHFHSIIRYLIGIAGCISTCFLCKYLINFPIISNKIISIGKITLPIYVLHQTILLLNLLVKYMTDNYFIIFLMSIFILCLSIFIYYILRKQSLLKYFLFGETN